MNRYCRRLKKAMVELYQEGRTVKELSEDYCISKSTLYKWTCDSKPKYTIMVIMKKLKQ